MKKSLALIFCFLLLAGCAAPAAAPTPVPEAGATAPASTPTAAPTPTPVPTEPPPMTVTIPAAIFEGEDMNDIVKAGEEKGFTAVILNDDGSVTYTMTPARYEQYLEECKTNTISSLESLSADFPVIKDVKCNDDLTEIRMIVDKADWTMINAGTIFVVGTTVQFYFQITGQEDMKTTVTAVDEATGEVLNTGTYPQEE